MSNLKPKVRGSNGRFARKEPLSEEEAKVAQALAVPVLDSDTPMTVAVKEELTPKVRKAIAKNLIKMALGEPGSLTLNAIREVKEWTDGTSRQTSANAGNKQNPLVVLLQQKLGDSKIADKQYIDSTYTVLEPMVDD